MYWNKQAIPKMNHPTNCDFQESFCKYKQPYQKGKINKKKVEYFSFRFRKNKSFKQTTFRLTFSTTEKQLLIERFANCVVQRHPKSFGEKSFRCTLFVYDSSFWIFLCFINYHSIIMRIESRWLRYRTYTHCWIGILNRHLFSSLIRFVSQHKQLYRC